VSTFLLIYATIFQESITQMKKLHTSIFLILFLVSCQKDDEILVPVQTINPPTIEETLTDTTVELRWADINADFYIVEYGFSGFSQNTGNTVRTENPHIVLTGLEPETTYDYYVSASFNGTLRNIVRSIRGFTTMAAPVSIVFKETLSEMRIFRGALGNLTPSPYAFIYDLNTRLYTDYASKQRLIAIPLGTSMVYAGDGLPVFPDNTVIAKTFYYNHDDRNPGLGRQLIETRVMILQNGTWEFGNYIWNEAQNEAFLDDVGGTTPISWIDNNGNTRNIAYKIPSEADCFTCHQSYGNPVVIGPKLRSMNFDINGTNQLEHLISQGYLTGLADHTSVQALPDWEDTRLTDESRVRAYFDMNCAHCHSDGGYHNENYSLDMKFDFETPFEQTGIFEHRYSIMTRILTSIEGYSMPYLGVTLPHQEALDLIVPYLETLE